MTERDYIVIGLLTLLVIYHVLTTFSNKKSKGFMLFTSFLFVVGYVVLLFYKNLYQSYFEYYYFAVLGFFAIDMFMGNLWKYFKKDLSEFDFIALEEELEDLESTSELLRKRFISTIEIMDDGIAFMDSDGFVFGSDRFIEYFGLENNEFSASELYQKIHRDDLPQYKNTIEKTSKKNPLYSIDYRILRNENILWVKEKGKRIEINKKITYISIIKILDIKLFPQTEIDVLNGLQNTKKLLDEMQKLNRLKTPYNLLNIQLTNIPQINEKYGRDVGDLMMGEYLKKLRYNFIKDNASLFRIGGINFGMIIKDEKKYEILVRALQGSGELLNLKMEFGGITQTLYPNIGISESPYEGKSPDRVFEEAKKALEISLNHQSTANFCFFDRI